MFRSLHVIAASPPNAKRLGELGDADCYPHTATRGERAPLAGSRAVAEGYSGWDIPLGWMLVNDGYGFDGYGFGYEDLPETAEMLHDNGIEFGLRTEPDLTEQEYEVSNGVRVHKTDVAWVGPGHRFALDACGPPSWASRTTARPRRRG